MIKISTIGNYDFYLGQDEQRKSFYNIVPKNSKPPNSGYYDRKWIEKIKLIREDQFDAIR